MPPHPLAVTAGAMEFDRDGAHYHPGAFPAAGVEALKLLLAGYGNSARLGPIPGLSALIAPADAIARTHLAGARPVFARYFDKSRDANWSLAWHQDRTIALAARADVPGFTAWTVKSGFHHAVPPFGYLARMLVLRIHLDDTGEAAAPLRIAPGSHRLGAIPEPAIRAAVARCGTHACLAAAGDVWAYAAPILHASGAMQAPGRRRILQLAYSADALPDGLDWLGV